MLTVVVGAYKENIITIDGKKMRVYPLFVENGKQLSRFQDCLDYQDVQDVEIFFMRRFLVFFLIKLKLTAEIRKSIVEFLHRYRIRDTNFDCYSFASLLHGLEGRSKSCMWSLWNFCRPRLLPRSGDIIFLLDEDRKDFHHAAVYIGLGLYLSVYGVGGDLEVSTLKDMKRDYGAANIVRAVPKT